MSNPQDKIGAIVWQVLFGESVEDLPDPNKPENSARINATIKAKRAEFKSFAAHSGKPFFDAIQVKIRADLFGIAVTDDTPDCNCKTCAKLREIRQMTKMLAWAQELCSKDAD